MFRRSIIIIGIMLSLFGTLNILIPTTVTAQGAGAEECSKDILGFPTWFRYLDLNDVCDVVGPTQPKIDSEGNQVMDEDGNPATEIDWQKTSGYVAVAVLEILLRIGALVAVGYVIYGGFKFITSQGEPENAKNARSTIINAVIGLVITIAAASIVSFIATRLTT